MRNSCLEESDRVPAFGSVRRRVRENGLLSLIEIE